MQIQKKSGACWPLVHQFGIIVTSCGHQYKTLKETQPKPKTVRGNSLGIFVMIVALFLKKKPNLYFVLLVCHRLLFHSQIHFIMNFKNNGLRISAWVDFFLRWNVISSVNYPLNELIKLEVKSIFAFLFTNQTKWSWFLCELMCVLQGKDLFNDYSSSKLFYQY